jgi:Family of unknown function (DUF6055)
MRVRRQIGISLLLAAVSLGLGGAANASASPHGVQLSPHQASKALKRATRLLAPVRHRRARPSTPKELTTTLLALSRSLSSLGPSQRQRAESLLARPTDNPDPDGSAYTVPEQPPVCSAHFCIHYVASTPDAPSLVDANGNGVPDYVGLVDSVAEQVYSVENVAMGWQLPKSDGTRGGDSRTDIYLVQLGGQLFGYSAPDAGQTGRTQSAYLVVDNDYSPTEYPGTEAFNDLAVTLAHEYNHVLQFGYDVNQDLWFYEATAVWMEDHVYPEINDYLRYIRRWVVRSKLPITRSNIKIYGTAVWNHWLAGRFGDTIVRNAWERAPAVKPSGFSVDAYNAALRAAHRIRPHTPRAGRQDLPHEFAQFAAATAEWETPGDFPYVDAPLWQDVKRSGTLKAGHFVVRKLSHTGYLLFNVRPRHVHALRLLAGAHRGTKSAFALICREGPVATGRVRIKMRFAKRGGVRGVTLRRPGRCSRITAALINADPREAGFAFGDWIYRHDHERFAATLVLRR